MKTSPDSNRLICRSLPPWGVVVLSLGVGASLTVSNNLATGIAVAGGLFVALLPSARRHR